MISFFQAVLMGCWYWFIDYGPLPGGYYTFYRPLVTGAFVGLVMGDVQTGVLVGAFFNMIFIGSLSVGGAQSNDPALGTILGTAFAIAGGLDTTVAATVAIPIALAGNLKNIFLMTFDAVWVRFSLKCIEKGDRKGLVLWNNIIPQIMNALMSCAIIVPACVYGIDIVVAVVEKCPMWLTNSLSVVGGLLPALGIALTLNMIGSGMTMPYFFLGFILTQYLGLDMIAIAALGFIIVALKVAEGINNGTFNFNFGDEEAEARPRVFTKKQIYGIAVKYNFQSHLCYQYERLQGISFGQTMGGILAKYYPDKDRFVEEWQKYTAFYNTGTFVGGLTFGLTMAMEEERSQGADEITPEAINTVRTSLMGPIAGIDDSFMQGAMMPITSSICIALAMSDGGTLLGPILNLILNHAILGIILLGTTWLGYKYGRNAVGAIMGSGLVDKLTETVGTLGCMVLGAMACQFVSVTTNINILLLEAQDAESEALYFNLQTDLFDMIFKGLVPLLFTLLTYWLLKKKQMSVNKVLVILVVIALIGGATGILAI